ncbi:MAG: hypothetical protein JEZ01_03505 [Labilibaculum sp.]|nr:hypothetical protein [Labilibaculum sp.]MBI9056819.1 hypothetical protein [Labilibaculum sp.]
MSTIRFSTNWNGKLNNQSFTTLRVHDPLKFRAGTIFSVEVDGKLFVNAKVITVKTMCLNEITEFEARLDSGYSRREFINLIKRLYRNRAFLYSSQKFDLVLFERMDSQVSLNI